MPIFYEDNLEGIRSRRGRLLLETDWTQLPDSPLTDAKKQEWAVYRTALRNLPESVSDLENVSWPNPPA